MIIKRQLIEARQNIVVIEDDFDSTSYFKKVLDLFSECNIKYFSFPNSDFFKFIEDTHVDLFIMDINLGCVNGIKVSQEIVNKKRGSIFLFVSGFDQDSENFEILKGQCVYDFLTKPIDTQCLITVISTLLNIASSYKVSFKNTRIHPRESQMDELRQHYYNLLDEDKKLIEKLKNSCLVIK